MITSPSGASSVPVLTTGPQAESVYISQLRDAVGYSKVRLEADSTEPISIPDGISRLLLFASAPLDALTITLPVNPVDGQQVFVFSSQPIGKMTVLAGAGQTLNGPQTEPKPESKAEARARVKAEARAELEPESKAETGTEPEPEQEAPSLKMPGESTVGFLYSLSDKSWDRIQ